MMRQMDCDRLNIDQRVEANSRFVGGNSPSQQRIEESEGIFYHIADENDLKGEREICVCAIIQISSESNLSS